MQSNKIFGTAIIAWVFLANICYAAVGKNLSLEFSGEIATFNYSEAPWRGEFAGVDLYACERAATSRESNAAEKCTLYQNSQKQSSGIGTVSGAGLHLLEFYLPKKAFLGDKIKKQVVYSQYIAILPASNADVSRLATQFSPKFSFYKNPGGTKEESYFPVSVSDLFTRNFSDVGDSEFQDGLRDISDADSLLDILSFNGSTENKISLDKSVAKAIKGNKDNFPVYWFHQKSGDELWITYFVLYAFDEKNNEYLSGGRGETFGEHSVDRESVTIKFTKEGNNYVPRDVIYAGHLETQPTTFLGCLTVTDCSSKGSLNARWEGGKTTVNWLNTSRNGNNPIVYVAHGSHAMKPAYGWYHLRVDSWGCLKIGCDVTEPAGNSIANNLSNGSLVAVDFEKPEFLPLTYSGFLIKGGDAWYRIFPFVRFPIDKWASTSNTVFNDCVASKQGCENYINQAIAPAITDLTFTPATANTAAKLTAIFSTDMQSGYSTTGAYVPKVGKEGYWPDARTFVVEFSSVTSGGQITLVASGFKSVSGQTMATDRVYTFPAQSTQNLLLGAPVTDSCIGCTDSYNGALQNITDGNLETARNIARYSGTFHIFLDSPKTISLLKLLPSMSPNGLVTYEIQTSTDPRGAIGTWTSHGGVKSSQWATNTWFDFTLNTNTQNIRVIKVNVTYTPSWLAFLEIEGYAQ